MKEPDDIELLVRKIAKCERLMKKPGVATSKLKKKRSEYILQLGEIAYQAALASTMNLAVSPTTVTDKLDPTKFAQWNDSFAVFEQSATSLEGSDDSQNVEVTTVAGAAKQEGYAKVSYDAKMEDQHLAISIESGHKDDQHEHKRINGNRTDSYEQMDENQIAVHPGLVMDTNQVPCLSHTDTIAEVEIRDSISHCDSEEGHKVPNFRYSDKSDATAHEAVIPYDGVEQGSSTDAVEKTPQTKKCVDEFCSDVEINTPEQDVVEQPFKSIIGDRAEGNSQRRIDESVPSSATLNVPIESEKNSRLQNADPSNMDEPAEVGSYLPYTNDDEISIMDFHARDTTEPAPPIVAPLGSPSTTSSKGSDFDGDASVSKLRAMFDSPTGEKSRRSWKPKKLLDVPPTPLSMLEDMPKYVPPTVTMRVRQGLDEPQSVVTLRQAVMTSSVHEINSPLVALVSLFPESMYDYLPKQNRALLIFKALSIEPIYVDGSNPHERERRDELFRLSGKRGVYPQLFVRKQGRLEFFADFDKVELLNDCQTLKEDLDAACR